MESRHCNDMTSLVMWRVIRSGPCDSQIQRNIRVQPVCWPQNTTIEKKFGFGVVAGREKRKYSVTHKHASSLLSVISLWLSLAKQATVIKKRNKFKPFEGVVFSKEGGKKKKSRGARNAWNLVYSHLGYWLPASYSDNTFLRDFHLDWTE